MAGGVTLNMKELKIAIDKSINNAALPLARQIAKENFNKELDRFTSAIENDDVSKEIVEGPELKRSKFISGPKVEEHGANLFSFLGFYAKSKPIQELTDFIKKTTKINTFNVKLINNQYTFKVEGLSAAEIKSAFPFPDGVFGHRSWINGVENGVANIFNYIRKLKFGRSTGGIQVQGNTGKSFPPQKHFFTTKYQEFVERLRGLRK